MLMLPCALVVVIVFQLRTFYYSLMSTFQCEDAQKKGIVFIMWFSDVVMLEVHQSIFTQMMRMRELDPGFPRNISAVHFLLNQQYLRPLAGGIRWFLREDLRAKMLVHVGGFEEIRFKLQTFGIPTDCLPFGPNATLENHFEWIQSRRMLEEKSNGHVKTDILVPRRFDVLFGRGQKNNNHTGNLRAAHIAEMFREKYEAAGKYEKTTIAERIVVLIRESHGRFLRWEDGVWVEVDQQAARNKVGTGMNHG